MLPEGTRPSPNIWHHTSTYEIENHAVDPDGRLWSAMSALADWAGRDVLDLGCGTGFHLPRFAETAATVTGVEPHPDLVALARRRTRRLPSVTVHQGTAQALPLPEASVDVVHARWAYFFGPGCEPGLAELDRVVRRGGVALVIDNDPTRSTFGGVVPARLPEAARPGGRRAVLVDAWLDAHAGRHGLAVLLARRPRGRRTHRVRRRDRRRRSWPSTRASRSTTRSTSGRAGSEPDACRNPGLPGTPGSGPLQCPRVQNPR